MHIDEDGNYCKNDNDDDDDDDDDDDNDDDDDDDYNRTLVGGGADDICGVITECRSTGCRANDIAENSNFFGWTSLISTIMISPSPKITLLPMIPKITMISL